jgi:hypothetical protein
MKLKIPQNLKFLTSSYLVNIPDPPLFGRIRILSRKQPIFEDENNKYVDIKILFASINSVRSTPSGVSVDGRI